MATPDNPDSGPTNCIGMKYPMADSIRNMADQNMAVRSIIDTSAGVSLMNFLISLDSFLL